MKKMKSLVWLCVLVMTMQVFAGDKEIKLSPGRTIYIDFPELGKTWSNKNTRMGIYLPEDYNLEASYPLFVWFGGGYGSDSPKNAMSIVGKKGFVCVGLPYHHDDKDGSLSTGGWAHTPWSYFQTMLDDLERRVPNINPEQRFCSGFSSGGAAIVSLIGRTNGAFQDYFYAFMPGGAVGQIKGFDTINGRPMYGYIGKKDSRLGGYKRVETAAKAAGVDVTMLFYDAGHTMPKKHFGEMRQWIIDKVVMRGIADLMMQMNKSVKAKKYGAAYQAAKKICTNAPHHAKEYKAAKEIMAEMKPHGEKLALVLQQGRLDYNKMKAYALTWSGCEFAELIEAKCTELAQGQLTKILGQKVVSATYLEKFLKLWEGFEVTKQAHVKYDELAQEKLTKILKSKSSNSSKISYLKKFITKWQRSSIAQKASTEIDEIAKLELDKIREISRASSRKSKLKIFIRTYAGSKQVSEAEQLLEKLK